MDDLSCQSYRIPRTLTACFRGSEYNCYFFLQNFQMNCLSLPACRLDPEEALNDYQLCQWRQVQLA